MLHIRFALAFAAALMMALPSSAEESVPRFWDARQRLSVPDLSGFQRIRFLTTTDFFPFNMLDAQGNLVGFHIDLARAICRQLEVEARCQIQALPFDELAEALEKNEGEAIIAGLALTAEARSDYSFSRPYFQFPARFVTRRDAPLGEPLHRALRGKRVGVLAGSAHEKMLRELFSGVDVATFPSDETLFEAIRKSEIAAIFGDGTRLSFELTGADAAGCCLFAGGPYLAPEYLGHGLAIAVRPEQSALTAAFDYALQRLEAEGVFVELYLRYFPINFYEEPAAR